MADLVRMVRNAGEVVDVRPEWVEEWQGWGWRLPDVAGEAGAEAAAPRKRGRPRKAVE